MSSSTPRSTKRQTSNDQFYSLVSAMEEHPELATNAPTFGSNKAESDRKWDDISKSLNALGPPERVTAEWKKVWADLKSRTKKKIAENNKYLKGTGGGPGKRLALTELEKTIDRVVHLSVAAAPEGDDFGLEVEDSTNDKFNLSPPSISTIKADQFPEPDFLVPRKKKYGNVNSAKKSKQDEKMRLMKEQVQALKDVAQATNSQNIILKEICEVLRSIAEK